MLSYKANEMLYFVSHVNKTRGWQLPRIFVHFWPESRRIPIILFFKILIL